MLSTSLAPGALCGALQVSLCWAVLTATFVGIVGTAVDLPRAGAACAGENADVAENAPGALAFSLARCDSLTESRSR